MSVPLFPSSIVPTPVDPSLVLVCNLTYRPSNGKTTGVTPPRMRSRTPRKSFNPSSLQSRLMGRELMGQRAMLDELAYCVAPTEYLWPGWSAVMAQKRRGHCPIELDMGYAADLLRVAASPGTTTTTVVSYAANAARKDGEQKITPGCAHEATLHMQAHGSNTVSIITISISTKLKNPSRISQQECTRKGTKERYGQNDP
ncbi:hypothetical protein CPAR01_06280 [Colletotrichum paranaense]|uniref:Uncharacterized protein n=1 Tax=Colletotrichum paranaense TaxID=1914294 RepID=A0ABQ9STQ0_9PEZI|nr:uncharacterized protein CPAR01_06280 [Colletotrichum paranaense]KAK1542893.1 hypothetical protein CPAR01_06280 [Colletotrichum paranaense]